MGGDFRIATPKLTFDRAGNLFPPETEPWDFQIPLPFVLS
jgi:hypothetical protein